MELKTFEVSGSDGFKTYLLSDILIKKVNKEFEFYNIKFYRGERCKKLTVYLDYPRGNVYWFIEFKNFVDKEILSRTPMYVNEWEAMLKELKDAIHKEYVSFSEKLKKITQLDVVKIMNKYSLRDYQAFDTLQLIIKMNENTIPTGLILSEQRTGKTRVAIATSLELLNSNSLCVIVCPKSAILGWRNELEDTLKIAYIHKKDFKYEIIKSSKLKMDDIDPSKIQYRIITYDILKRLTITQLKLVLGLNNFNEVMFMGDECHRLRNFKTMQSDSIFKCKELLAKSKHTKCKGIIGITGTPSVKASYDIFGSLSYINFSKISLDHTVKDFNEFKEYFYNCEDTSFGKVCKTLKKKSELRFFLKTCSIQTKQKNLDLFKNYTKVYKKIELKLDEKQHIIYQEVLKNMEYEDCIDCENKLVRLIRLKQICTDPSVLVPSYVELPPKFRYLLNFVKKNLCKIIIFSKTVSTLNSLKEIFDKNCIKNYLLTGSLSLKVRQDYISSFKSDETIQVLLMQQDVGREALTLPEAKVTIFLDRDFAQGYNEQAEARMTPIDGSKCTKYVIDLVMENTIEDEIYNTLVVKKESIGDVNVLYNKIIGKGGE